MSIVEGFGGMRVKDDHLCFTPQIPKQWTSYSFKINFRNQIVTITVSEKGADFEISGSNELMIQVNDKPVKLVPGKIVHV